MKGIFSSHKLSSFELTVGEQLRRSRLEREISITQAAKKLNIRPAYLEALEAGDRAKLPAGVYTKNFLREYARFLGLDYAPLLKQFDEEGMVRSAPTAPFQRQIVSRRLLVAVPIVVRNLIIGLVAVFCLIYLGLLVKRIFEPPPLIIASPAADITTTERSLLIEGHSDPETEVRINDDPVQVGAEGNFRKEVFLERGLNTIVVTAKKKYSRQASLTRFILFEEIPPSINSSNQ